MMNLQWFDLVGFIGVFMVLGAYAGHQTQRLRSDGFMYSFINLLGAIGILVPVLYADQMNWSIVFIEVAWIGISLYGIYRYLQRQFAKPLA